MSDPRVIIIGGGVSGLAAAYYLSKQGVHSILLEKSERIGGLIRTDHLEGCDLEAGPDSFIASKPSVPELAEELGLGKHLIDSNDAGRRVFIGRRAKLVPMPQGLVMMAPADLGTAFRSSFFGFPTKIRFALELLRKPQHRKDDVSLGRFVVEHFGSEVLETIAEPLFTGVYGGDPAALSMKSVLPRFLEYERQYGSVIRGVQQERLQRKPGASLFRSFAGGMQLLTDALKVAITSTTQFVREEALTVTACHSRSGNRWTVATSTGSFSSNDIVVAVPAHTGSQLLATVDGTLSSLLGEIPYSSAILVTHLFDRATLGHPLDGFGFLIPRGERRTTAAATWISTKFPSRTPPATAAIRSFIVGEQAIRMKNLSDASIVAEVGLDLRHWMNIQQDPYFLSIVRWPQSMPQYLVGHTRKVEQIRSRLADLPGLHLCGNAYEGVGIPDCVRLAKAAATSMVANMQ